MADLLEKLKSRAITAINRDTNHVFDQLLNLNGENAKYGGSEDDQNFWSGMTRQQAKLKYRELHALGTLSKAHYLIRFRAYENNFTAGYRLVTNGNLGWLAIECDIPILEADVESVKIGHTTVNRLTGKQSKEFNIQFLETSQGDIWLSCQSLEGLIFHPNGTMRPPAQYAMWLDYVIYDRKKGFKVAPIIGSILVALKSASIAVAAADGSPLIVQTAFTQLMPYMQPLP